MSGDDGHGRGTGQDSVPHRPAPVRVGPESARRRRVLAAATLTVPVLGYLVLCRVDALASLGGNGRPPFVILYTLTCLWLLWQTLLAYAERPYRASAEQQAVLDAAHVAVLVPVYNEDAPLLRRCLRSLLDQTRLPDSVDVTDDGSGVAYDEVREWFERAAADAGVRVSWQRTENLGKRHAQIRAAAASPDADYFVTIDSDTELDRLALHELQQPFTDDRVQSVAAIVMSANARASRLTRLFDMYSLSWQLNERSAQSVLGSVVVNTGCCASYRAEVLRDNARAYLDETFMGRPVAFSDDSLLTLLARLRGRTVQQPTAFARATMPQTLDHHLRQQLRWMRGSAIRSFWRVRYLPLNGYAFWNQTVNWFVTLAAAAAFTWFILLHPISNAGPLPLLLLVPVVVGYLHSLRYLAIRPDDERLRSRLLVFACAPVVTLWSFTVLRALRWYGLATCARTGWLTRENVEVYADTGPLLPAGPRRDGVVAAAPGVSD
ncbi:glycosyltransferase family 2 protein [Streptomyces sp. SID9727]|uniref:glycosyltransferase n=1 Tax=Streptomyces sp. SID9727 TaxID=2706114 RepID=UPI0013CB1A47|nr:glycosyltransferase family 2 protein [Streptomyces sp. SID9727]NEC65351.1 glycosyltransferase [Streptomyces sp. SID9727]